MASARIRIFVLLACLLSSSCSVQRRENDLNTRVFDAASTPAGTEALAEPKALPVKSEGSYPSAQPAIERMPASQPADRKIVRRAEIALETSSPKDVLPRVGAISAKYGGFIVTSEFHQNDVPSQAPPSTVVNITLRVPARDFENAIAELYGLGGHVLSDKRSGQDVTEEYVDLEARLRAKRALEMQFLDIMKQAHKVADALEVQTQLGQVRTEIEQLEGRRRFLENQSALSTINLKVSPPPPVVTATTRGFFFKLKTALGDGVDVGSEIVLDIVRFGIVMVPIAVFILIPLWLVFRWLLRRRVLWSRPADPSVATSGD